MSFTFAWMINYIYAPINWICWGLRLYKLLPERSLTGDKSEKGSKS